MIIYTLEVVATGDNAHEANIYYFINRENRANLAKMLSFKAYIQIKFGVIETVDDYVIETVDDYAT
jgi:hypothetical protein